MDIKKILKMIVCVGGAFTAGWFLRSFQSKATVVYQDIDEKNIGDYARPIELTDKPESAKYTFYGGATIENKVFQDLKIFGPAKVTHSIVKKNASVFGPLQTSDTTYHNLSVNGALHAETSQINYALLNGSVLLSNVRSSEMLSINGALSVEFCDLNNVEVSAVALSINESRVKNIFIHVDKNQKSKSQRVTVSGNTEIGTITFEGGNGVVRLEGDSIKIKTIQGGRAENVLPKT